MDYSPLISVIIPTYNAERFIIETLTSVINQSYTHWECIIIDDGSTDSTKEIIDEYCKADNRIKYYYQKNSGPSVARNVGVKIALGEYIQFLDSDDVLLPERFEILL
ncbi:MAG: glycosyltransferase family 2 protein, partial [Bacteroidales bacterium]